MKHKVLFKGSDDIKRFAKEMDTFVPDINLYYGHQIFDAKSIICLMSLQLFKEYEVELLTQDEQTQKIFASIVSEFSGG